MKHSAAKQRIAAALQRVSEARGVTVEELEETSVPTFALDERSTRRQRVGSFEAEIFPESPRKFALRWRKGSRSPTTRVPDEVTRSKPAAWVALERELKEINGLLAAQRFRLERFLLSPRTWRFEAWQQCYLHHPVVGVLARALIWELASGQKSKTAIWSEGRLIDAKGTALPDPAPDTQVTLWHPLNAAPNEVLAWRCWLEEFLLAQPFRQAFREINRPVSKELSATSSARFAGHVLKQHQFAALARERGWRYQLQGGFDSYNVPTLAIPEANLTAELDVCVSGDDDISASGIFVHVRTRQVRFRDAKRRPVPLKQVPPRVFSEVMRDVDLFVSVASIGNDPAWPSRNSSGADAKGWQQFAFGELTSTAETRRAALEKLLPRLELKASLAGRFLVVHGKLRSYKIHLGSGHVLMQPNDEFLVLPESMARDQRPQFGNLLRPYEDDLVLGRIVERAALLSSDLAMHSVALRNQISPRN